MVINARVKEPRDIVIIGGGVVGCSTAYFLTRHSLYNPQVNSVTILEANSIAGGSSGKAGGLLATWATPKCLAPLSFETHAGLAKEHGGDRIWGYRRLYCANVKLQAQPSEMTESSVAVPSALDWLLSGALKSYEEAGNPSNTAQVNPYMFTTTLAKLAEEKGAKVVYGYATSLKYQENGKCIHAVEYTHEGKNNELMATDVVVAAGPWTPKIYPSLKLGKPPRGHSIVVRPSRDLSPYVLFPEIEQPEDGSLSHILSPEIYPRPGDSLHAFNTVYACGPDDYTVPLPDTSDQVDVDQYKCEDIRKAVRSVSDIISKGEVITRQACYRSQIRPHNEGEEVGPIVGPVPGLEGVWLATGHDEWGIQNSAGTGLVLSEMILEGEAKSADCETLHPKHFLKTNTAAAAATSAKGIFARLMAFVK